MSSPVLVIGHKNPDNDSICAAVAYAYLKNELERRRARATGEEPVEYIPARLGPLPAESEKVLARSGLEAPVFVSHVFARVSDIMDRDPQCVRADATLMDAARLLRVHNVSGLVVIDDDGLYRGLVTRRMMGERYLEATASLDSGASQMSVASDLIASLDQRVEDITETDVLILDKDDRLNGAIGDLMESALQEAIVLDEDGRAIGFLTRSTVAVRPRRKVILVDHNERRQAADGIDEAEIVEIIDHHRIADIKTSNPIRFLNLPVGSTATIVALEFERNGVDMPAGIAAALLSAVMTDTVLLKSPTATETDRLVSERLGRLVGQDPVDFGMDVLRMRGGEEGLPVEKLVSADSKEFALENGRGVCLIAQHETVDLSAVLEREQEIREYMRGLLEKYGYEFVLFMATDILAEGSQFICEGDRSLLNRAFDVECTGRGGIWMSGVLSRKKQVAARILGA